MPHGKLGDHALLSRIEPGEKILRVVGVDGEVVRITTTNH